MPDPVLTVHFLRAGHCCEQWGDSGEQKARAPWPRAHVLAGRQWGGLWVGGQVSCYNVSGGGSTGTGQGESCGKTGAQLRQVVQELT